MKRMNRTLALGLSAGLMLSGCAQSPHPAETSAAAAETEATVAVEEASEEDTAHTNLPKIDNSKWLYNKDDDVYYQLGISYCETPADTNYEELAILVPGAYMNATDNGDGTFTCTLNETAELGGYTASTAPIVMPVNTPGYAAQDPMTEYTSESEYTSAGFIYVHAGCRGRDAGAPAGVTDLKAAIRYLRYNAGTIAGDTERIFSFGMSGGGAQSALLGVTGDSALYEDYLDAIGAVEGVSDAVLGAQSWCPITSLDSGDEAYEWMMGNTRSGLSDEEQTISDRLTVAYAAYINELGLTDEEGNALTLEESDDGRYQAGSYYDYMKDVIEESLNNFLSDTSFPYDADAASAGGPGGGMGPGGMGPQGGPGPDGAMAPFDKDGSAENEKPQKEDSAEGSSAASGDQRQDKPEKAAAEAPSEEGTSTPEKSAASLDGSTDFTAIDQIQRTENKSGVTISGTYETAQDYIDALNANGTWVNYDAATNTATITSIADFAKAVKTASKGIAAFDQLDASQGENTLFGYGDGKGAHFDATLAEILKDMDSSYADAYSEDLARKDALGHSVTERVEMYSPLYYLLPSSEGYQSSTVAKYFRINTGLWQGDTAVNTEANLALALKNEGASVESSFVWGQQHTMAERSGDATSNFIAWVNQCLGQ